LIQEYVYILLDIIVNKISVFYVTSQKDALTYQRNLTYVELFSDFAR